MVPELFDSGLPRSDTDVLTKLYELAAAKLREVVLNPPGGTAGSREYRQAWAAQQVRQLDIMLTDLKSETAKWIGANLPKAFLDGIEKGTKQAQQAGVMPRDGIPGHLVSGSFSLIDQGTLKVFAQDIYTDLSGAADSMGQRGSRLLKATAQNDLSEHDIDTILAGGVIEGRPQDAIRSLREEFRHVAGDQIAVRTKTGGTMNFEVGYYASMVARTRTRQATVHSRHYRLRQLGLDLVSIVGRLSKNFCTAYLGQVYSLGGRSDKYPSLASLPGGGPPFHPNCSKSTRPFVEALASEKQIDDAEGDDDQSKMLDIDPATAQRRFKDLQIEQQVRQRYASTAAKMFG